MCDIQKSTFFGMERLSHSEKGAEDFATVFVLIADFGYSMVKEIRNRQPSRDKEMLQGDSNGVTALGTSWWQ